MTDLQPRMQTVDIESIKYKLHERLKNSGWGDKLRTFILSNDFTIILQQLLMQAKSGERFTPVVKQLFRAFEECPYKDLKVVMIGQDPYPGAGTADGIAFSCSNLPTLQPSLKFMLKEIEDTIPHPEGYTWDQDLARWSNQGVLMLNSALTTTIGKINVHGTLWRPFMTFLFDMLGINNPELIYVFMGKVAQEWMDHIMDNNVKLTCMHPASAVYGNKKFWDSGDIFNSINLELKKQNNPQILW